MFDELANLCAVTITQDAAGNEVQGFVKTPVFVHAKSIGMREQYLAAQIGIKPEFTFVLSDYSDYSGQGFIEYGGTVYTISRTYRNGMQLEITVTRKEGNLDG